MKKISFIPELLILFKSNVFKSFCKNKYIFSIFITDSFTLNKLISTRIFWDIFNFEWNKRGPAVVLVVVVVHVLVAHNFLFKKIKYKRMTQYVQLGLHKLFTIM